MKRRLDKIVAQEVEAKSYGKQLIKAIGRTVHLAHFDTRITPVSHSGHT